MTSCAPSVPEKIVPYVISPKGLTPTVSEYYATSMELDGFATGLLVRMAAGIAMAEWTRRHYAS